MRLKLKKVFEVERVISQLSDIKAAKLAYALGRNAKRVREVTEPARDQLKGSNKFQEYNREVTKAFQSGKTNDEIEQKIEKLKDEFEVRDEIKELQDKEKELLEMEVEIEWYQIAPKIIPGLGDDDNLSEGVLPTFAISTFISAGLIPE